MGTGRRSGEQRNQATSSHELKNKRRSRRGKGINSRELIASQGPGSASQGPGSVSLATGKQRRRRGGSSPANGRAGSPASSRGGSSWTCRRRGSLALQPVERRRPVAVAVAGARRRRGRRLVGGGGGRWTRALRGEVSPSRKAAAAASA